MKRVMLTFLFMGFVLQTAYVVAEEMTLRGGHGAGGNEFNLFDGRDLSDRGEFVVEMQTNRGEVLDTFFAPTRNMAIRECEMALRDRGNPYASCELVTESRSGRDGGFDRRDPRGPRDPRDHRGPRDPRGPRYPHDPGYPGHQENWTCTAFDNGTEEHFGGHQGFGYDRVEAERDAMDRCERVHGGCYIRSCGVN